MTEALDIRWKNPYPSNALSNFYPHAFIMDGVPCASMEGFLQSLKFRDETEQKRVCALSDTAAKAAGAKKFWWKITGNLYWRGKRYKRKSREFYGLRLRAYLALAENPQFIAALACAEGRVLTHSCGKHAARKTVLTEEEFLDYLNRIREIKGIA